jgi:hypothetical protein
MSRVKKQLSMLSVLFGLGFLSLGLLTCATFSWTVQRVSPPLSVTARADGDSVKLHFPAKAGRRVDLTVYDEPTPRSEGFFSAKQSAEFSLRRIMVFPFRFKCILPLTIPRYIFKSVLNI